MPLRVSLAVVACLLSFSVAAAEMYQWVDKNGVVTFKDTPPPPSRHKKVKVYSAADFDTAPARERGNDTAHSPASAPQNTSSQRALQGNPRFNGTVELYVTSWCRFCREAVSYLNAKGIPYVAYDIEKDSAAKQRHKDLGGRGVPLIIVGSHRMSGFSAELLESYLQKSN